MDLQSLQWLDLQNEDNTCPKANTSAFTESKEKENPKHPSSATKIS